MIYFFHIQIHLHLQLYHKNLLNFLLFFFNYKIRITSFFYFIIIFFWNKYLWIISLIFKLIFFFSLFKLYDEGEFFKLNWDYLVWEFIPLMHEVIESIFFFEKLKNDIYLKLLIMIFLKLNYMNKIFFEKKILK